MSTRVLQLLLRHEACTARARGLLPGEPLALRLLWRLIGRIGLDEHLLRGDCGQPTCWQRPRSPACEPRWRPTIATSHRGVRAGAW